MNDKIIQKTKPHITRRQFLNAATAAAAFTIVPRHVLGGANQTPPSEKLNIAGVGIGGMGKGNLAACSKDNIVALCDVDDKYAGPIFERYEKAKKYRDFRKMLEKQKDIDAVIIATPDHSHATIAMAAMKMGKHVYVQKPLTWSVHEARVLTETAKKYNVTTQMGNQGHSGEGARLVKEWIQAGIIGNVREVNCFTNRPVWPTGSERGRPEGAPPAPETLDWDLWLGPAPERPYHPDYLPNVWRGWCAFGTGALGDMGCHIMDPPFWALELGYPDSIEAYSSTYWNKMWGSIVNKNEMFPRASSIRYKFPAKNGRGEVLLTWHDGGLMPQRPEELEEGRRMGDKDGGCIFIGDKGKLMCGCYGRSPRLIPESGMKDFKPPEKTLPRVEWGMRGHEQNWLEAIKTGTKASSDFDYSGPLTETVLLGNLAIAVGGKLNWDAEKLKFKNSDDANNRLHREYRQGWTL